MMNHKRLIVMLGIVITLGVLAIFANRSIPAAPAVESHTAVGVSPFDLQCTAKFPGGFAQCGSQASSCKSCHEVAGEDPINDKGDWHTQHAFGDFCEFCHSGNVQATDKAEAHTGMVEPLGDLKVNCAMCHAADYEAKAEPYAKTLGITLGGASGPTEPPASSAGTSETTPQQPAEPAQPAAEPAPQTAPQPAAAPDLPKLASNEVVDYVAQYKAEQPQPVNTASAVTGFLLAGVVVVGAVFVIWNERRQRAQLQRAAASLQTIMGNDERAQEMKQLLPVLEQLDVQALRGLRTFLSKNN